jgi:hypothetical protein
MADDVSHDGPNQLPIVSLTESYKSFHVGNTNASRGQELSESDGARVIHLLQSQKSSLRT